jgi:hypothetical protein
MYMSQSHKLLNQTTNAQTKPNSFALEARTSGREPLKAFLRIQWIKFDFHYHFIIALHESFLCVFCLVEPYHHITSSAVVI